MGPALCGTPVGHSAVLAGVAAPVAFWPGLGIFLGRGWLTMGYHTGTTQEGVTGFDFGS